MFKKLFIYSTGIFLLSAFSINITKAATNVQEIRINYCEDVWKWNIQNDSRMINIKPGEEKEICLSFSSSSTEKTDVFYWFTVWFLDWGSQLCRVNVKEENDFSKFFSNSVWNNRVFTIKPGETKTIIEKIKAPLWMSWMVYGCLLHWIAWWETKNKMFTIVALVKRSLNLFIGWDSDINKSIELLDGKWNIFSTNSSLWAKSVGENRITLNFSIKNNGNISQNITISWTINNFLWLEKKFTTKPLLVAPLQEVELSSNELLLPAYKWFFDAEFTLTGEPVFGFNTDKLDPKTKEPTILSETWTIFIFSRAWIIIALFIILILYLILRPIFKKHKISNTTKTKK